jgi:hypothetical protein
MKPVVKIIASLVLWTLTSLPALAATPPGRLQLPEFTDLGPKATESVSITLDAPVLAIAASFLDGGKPDELAVKQLIAGLKGIYVRSFTFDKDFAYPTAGIESLRKQITAQGWQKIVETRSAKEQAAVDIFISIQNEKPNGLAIIATEPRQLTVVNIVGAIDLDKLHRLEGKFGVPNVSSRSDATAPASRAGAQ